jgi:small subunit ribosomal protein S24e
MEVQIDSKKNNPLLDRTEVYFTVKHLGEKTPNREIVRNELAEKLNSKKENIVLKFIKPGFGTNETTGYAKIYSSLQKAKEIEETYILARNKLIDSKKKEKKTEKKPAEVTKPTPEKTEVAKTPIEETNEPPKEETKQKPAPEHEASHEEKDEKTQEKNSEETKG